MLEGSAFMAGNAYASMSWWARLVRSPRAAHAVVCRFMMLHMS